MKILRRILVVTFIILALLFSAAYIFVAVKGKAILTQQLKNALKREVFIGYLGLRLPLALEIKNLEIGKSAKIDYFYGSVSILGLFAKEIILNEVKLMKPEFNFQRGLPVVSSKEEGAPALQKSEKKQPLRIIIKRLMIKEGKINFTDQNFQPPIKIILKDLMFDLDNLLFFPESAISSFQLNGKIPWQENSKEEGGVYAGGWINLYRKDMQAEIRIEGIDGVYLSPYFSKWVDVEKARIEKARLNFRSNIRGQNNDVLAQCHLELTDIKFKPRLEDEPADKAEKIAVAVLDIFRTLGQGKIELDFSVKTKMDKPEFGFDNIRMAVEDRIAQGIKSDKVKVEDVAVLPGKLIEGMAKGATGATKAIIEGAVTVGKSLRDAVIDALKTDKQSKTEKQEESDTQPKD